jgi:hypothetical protein
MAGRFRLFSVIAAVSLFASTAWAGAYSLISRAIDYFVSAIAQPFIALLPSFDRLVASPALAYDAPAAHFLRHEAGVSRRSAARHT